MTVEQLATFIGVAGAVWVAAIGYDNITDQLDKLEQMVDESALSAACVKVSDARLVAAEEEQKLYADASGESQKPDADEWHQSWKNKGEQLERQLKALGCGN